MVEKKYIYLMGKELGGVKYIWNVLVMTRHKSLARLVRKPEDAVII